MDQIVEIQPDVTPRYSSEQEQLQNDLDGFTADDLDEVEYRPVPPHRAFKVKVKLRIAGPGKPMRYPLMDGE